MGLKSYKATSVTISPYVKTMLWDRLFIVLQPTLKYSALNRTDFDDAKSYYRVTGATIDSAHTIVPSDGVNPAKITRRYIYTQTHDSLSIGTAIQQKSFVEFEMPVLLQYKLYKGLNIYGGVSLNFSKIVHVGESRKEYSNIKRTDSLVYAEVPVTQSGPTLPSASSRFSYSSTPYGQYNGTAAIQNPTSTPARFSYMLGFNYELKRKLSLDLLLQWQGLLTSPDNIPDTRVRDIYMQPHIRFSVGYKLGK
jgi:hypothetical protein